MVTIEERVSRLEGAFEQLSMTLQSLENRITNLESRMAIMWATTMGTMVAGFITPVRCHNVHAMSFDRRGWCGYPSHHPLRYPANQVASLNASASPA